MSERAKFPEVVTDHREASGACVVITKRASPNMRAFRCRSRRSPTDACDAGFVVLRHCGRKTGPRGTASPIQASSVRTWLNGPRPCWQNDEGDDAWQTRRR